MDERKGERALVGYRVRTCGEDRGSTDAVSRTNVSKLHGKRTRLRSGANQNGAMERAAAATTARRKNRRSALTWWKSVNVESSSGVCALRPESSAVRPLQDTVRK